MPQGSVLGSLLFCLDISPLGKLIQHHSPNFQQYVDDNQVYQYLSQSDMTRSTTVTKMETAAHDIIAWMTKIKLQLNDRKT